MTSIHLIRFTNVYNLKWKFMEVHIIPKKAALHLIFSAMILTWVFIKYNFMKGVYRMLLSKLFRNNYIKVSMNMTEGKIHFITWLVSMYGPSAGLRLSTGFSHVAALGYIRGFGLYSRLWVIFEVLGYIWGFGLYLRLWVIFET